MATRVDPKLKVELQQFGIEEWNECYHCGNCTATCPLTEDNALFPRKGIRQIQMGLKKQLSYNLNPWLCYYCGECTETCPRNANPGEIMMSLRRYLTSIYDWTGLSRKFYTSGKWEVYFILFIAALVVALFGIFLPPSDLLFTNPELFVNAQGGVMINSMVDGIPPDQFVQIIEYCDWIMAAVVASLLISNILRMFYLVVIKDKSVHVPIYAYFTELWNLIWHFGTQSKFSKCEDKNYWVGHWLLMTGYTIMFILIVVVLPEFQIEEVKPWYNWQRLLGYYATFGILYFLIVVTIKRIRKVDLKAQFTHASDWLFIIMLGLTTISGILVHIFRVNGLPVATYYTYVAHMTILVPMIMIEVPFSKWSHLAYRPFAIYFKRLKHYSWEKQRRIELEKAV
ncbi:MAG: 4Fe-4S dicluster domain-containing protein [Marinifilaceae bacterium]